MAVTTVTPVLNVSSIGESFVWFEPLGWQRGFSWNEGGVIVAGPNAVQPTSMATRALEAFAPAMRPSFSVAGGRGRAG